ncbi:MAG: leucine-rich repeat domain-containing protein, partial [Coleofasciculaceae cyanobacterium]
MTFIVAGKRMNVTKQGVVKVLRLIVVTGGIVVSSSGLSALEIAQQPGNSGRFAQLCREKASLSLETKHTVEVLLQKAETTDCDAANQKLLSLLRLDLYNTKISDITPLQGLTNLNELNLGSNKISDITPLQGLTNLTMLWLDNNKISDITPLQGMTN